MVARNLPLDARRAPPAIKDAREDLEEYIPRDLGEEERVKRGRSPNHEGAVAVAQFPTAAAEQFCGVPNCLFYFPSSGDNCKSDGAAATGVGFLTAAAAVAAAL